MAMRSVLLAAIIICSAVLSGLRAEEATKAQRYREIDCFEIDIPAGWTKQEQYFGLSQAEKGIFGITLSAPGHGGPVQSLMSAHYYAPDNLMDKTPEKFIRIHSTEAPQNRAAFPTLPKVEGGAIVGLPIKIFGNITAQSSKPRSLNSERIEVWESFVVIPLKSGYYALRYTAAREAYEQNLAAFEAFIASFKPLKK
jgi:hypothetical protein